MNNQNIKVSVIVPVYNIEKFLPKCMESLTRQTFKNIEIICINDGSRDGSGEILNSYAQNDERIILINQENQGVSRARNRGLEIARGQYIIFVDSDDYVKEDLIEKLYSKALETGADIVASNTIYVKGEKLIKNNFISRQTFKIKKDILSSIPEKASFAKSVIVSGKLYSLGLVRNNNLRFLEGCRFEDNEFTFLASVFAEKIALENDAELYYVIHPASLMANVFNTDTVFDFIKVFRDISSKIYNCVDTGQISTDFVDVFNAHMTNAFYNTFKSASEKYKAEFQKRAAELLKNINTDNKYFDRKTLRRYNKLLDIKKPFWK